MKIKIITLILLFLSIFINYHKNCKADEESSLTPKNIFAKCLQYRQQKEHTEPLPYKLKTIHEQPAKEVSIQKVKKIHGNSLAIHSFIETNCPPESHLEKEGHFFAPFTWWPVVVTWDPNIMDISQDDVGKAVRLEFENGDVMCRKIVEVFPSAKWQGKWFRVFEGSDDTIAPWAEGTIKVYHDYTMTVACPDTQVEHTGIFYSTNWPNIGFWTETFNPENFDNKTLANRVVRLTYSDGNSECRSVEDFLGCGFFGACWMDVTGVSYEGMPSHLIGDMDIYTDPYALDWVQVNLDGFDPDYENRGKYNYGVFDNSFTVFNGKMYAGTDNPDNGPEVWFYAGDGSTDWTLVSESNTNPGKSIFYGNEATMFLEVFNVYLYAGTVYGENVPEGDHESGQVWRSNTPGDGDDWTKVFDYDDWLADVDNGDTGDVIDAIQFGGYIYLCGRAKEADNYDAQIFHSPDGQNWIKIIEGDAVDGFHDDNDTAAYSFEIFDGKLYVGVWNLVDGAEIWRTSDGTHWQQVNSNGFGSPDRGIIRRLITYGGYLYALITNTAFGWVEAWRSPDGLVWEQVGGNGLGDPTNNREARTAQVYNGCLYVGISGGHAINSGDGRVYQSCDGITFHDVTSGRLGDPANHAVVSLMEYNGYLYAATFCNTGERGGTEVWRMQTQPSE